MSYRSGLQMFAIMTNWKTEFHKPLTRPGVKHDEEMSICSSTPQAHRGYINSSLLESDLKISESHANVVSFDENVSTLSNLYERNQHLLMNETTVENMTTIGTVYESMMRNQRTYLANQDNKHRLEDECTDLSLNTSRNGVGEVSKRSRTGHNMLLAHAKAWHTYDKEFRKTQQGRVSIVVNAQWFEPKTDREEDIKAADRGMQWFLGWMAHPVFVDGDYPQVMKTRIMEKSKAQGLSSRLPSFSEEQKRSLKGTADFLALNFYSVSFAEHHDLSKEENVTWGYFTDQEMKTSRDPSWLKGDPSWLYCVPWGMRKMLVWLKQQYNDPEIIVTENGFSVYGEHDRELPAALQDTDRVTYIKGYINEALKAVKLDGVKLKGYFVWSLLDNFEWDDGYRFRFGIHRVDFDNPKRPRTPKLSAEVYKEIVANNGFP